MAEATDWLLGSISWVKYRTLVDALGKPENSPEAQSARRSILADQSIQSIISDLQAWPGPPITRHNDSAHLLHKLAFLADLGLKASDPGMNEVITLILGRQSTEGSFQVLANISPHFGGTGKDQLGWMLCDAPTILYALVKLGLGEDKSVQKAAQHLASLSTDNGWLCVVSPEMGKFHGPGRRTDPCPYATLIALKALAQFAEWRDSPVCRQGAEALLSLWDQRKERRPYLFAMGTDFAKLKAPLVWYDILHVIETLTLFPWLLKDRRLLEMADIVKSKADAQGRFTPESVWMPWKGWDFGQKKTPSPYITLQAMRILMRLSH
jgi:hypothetical protein